MKIYKPIGSKERFVEVFQRVNKVKLNENLMEAGSPNLNPENVLNVAFNQLKNNQLKIEHSNTQERGNENFVELLCTDNEGNNITFIFKAISSEGDQEDVYTISSVLLNSFSFDSADGAETLDLDENGLKQFNAQHANELLEVVQDYVDVSSPENAELEEAVKLIDAIKQNSYPFGGGDDRLQTGKNYADEKPTNDKVRVKSPELDKFIQENEQDLNPELQDYLKNMGIFGYKASDGQGLVLQFIGTNGEQVRFKLSQDGSRQFFTGSDREIPRNIEVKLPEIINKITQTQSIQEDIPPLGGVNSVGKKITTKEELKAYIEQKKANGGKFGREDTPLLAGEALYYIAVKMADGMLPMGWDGLADVNSMWDYIRKDGGMSFDQLKVAVKRAVNVRLKEEGYSLKDLGLGENLQEFDKPAMKLVIPKEANENMNLPIAGMPAAVTNVAEQEDDDIVGQEVNRFKQEIQPQNPEEIDVDDEPVPEVSPEKKDKILAAYENLTARNKSGYSPTTAEVMAELDKMAGKVVKKTPKPPIDFSNYIEENSEQSKQSLIMQAAKKVAEDLKRTGKPYVYEEFIPLVKEEALKLYNNIQHMSLTEGENINYPDPLGKEFKPKEHFPKQKKKRSKKVKLGEEEIYGDEDISGLPEVPSGKEAEKQAKSDIHKDPEYKRRGFSENNEDTEEEKSQLPGVDSDDEGNPIPAIEPRGMGLKPQNDDGMSHEPEGDEVAQIAQDKEEAGELIPGGKGEGKSPTEFSPEQILMGMKVEMEHTEDPMISLEITLDHLAEDPEYYTEKDTPEASAQFGAAKDTEDDGGDKEMTNMLLGFKPHNVGDEVDIEGDEEPEVTAPEEPEPANEPEKTPAEENPADEPEEKEKLSESKKVITNEQIKIAKTTLNRNIPTGMTKKEAVTILMNNNLRKIL